MKNSFLKYFYTQEFDKEILLKEDDKIYTFGEVKNYVYSQILELKKENSKNVIIETENNFDFIIIFLSCIFSSKHIFIKNTNNQKISIENSVILNKITNKIINYEKFDEISASDVKITLFTSGSTNKPKEIVKDLNCFINESKSLLKKFSEIQEKRFEFITTTTLNHLFGQTFYLFLALNSFGIINLKRINYTEDLKIKNAILAATPSFLSAIKKYNEKIEVLPEYIFCAGGKLEDDVHEFYCNLGVKLVNIYGSTESGIIANKTNIKEDFSLFDGIKIISVDENGTKMISAYALEKGPILIGDLLEITDNNKIRFLSRQDRVFKIQEKRVSLNEIEEELNKHKFVKNSYCIGLENKLGALVELSKEGIDYLLNKNSTVDLTKELKNFMLNKFQIIPQKWRFMDEFPTLVNGKIDKEKIKNLFDINLSLPLVLERKISKDAAEFKLFIYRNCNFFKGHFDSFPIVAGVVQLYFANYFSNLAFNLDCHIGQIKRIKFTTIIKPDSVVTLKLTKSIGYVNYEYLDENKSYSSGALPIENIFNGVKND